MNTKPLYLLVSNGGDGSYSIQMTLDSKLIEKMEAKDDLDYESDPGCDGDGFHYDTIQVPADATYESLGITYPFEDDGSYDE